MSKMDGLVPRSDFELPEGLCHMAPGAQSPSLRTVWQVLDGYVASKGTGQAGEEWRWREYARTKELAARLLQMPDAESIAFVPSVSDGMNQLSHSLPVRPGDNVVIEDAEFGAVLYPWLHLERQGVEVRLVRQRDWTPAEDGFRNAIDARTRAVVVSQVSYLTGLRHNVEALAEAAHASGAWLVFDATHAAGVVLTACYKWLLGWHGVALLAWNQKRVPEVEPGLIGWRTPAGPPNRAAPKEFTLRAGAARFETGNPSNAGIWVLGDALNYLLTTGLDRIEAHDLALAGELNERLRALGFEVATPLEVEHRAANTCFWHPRPESLANRLAEREIWVSGGEGRVRLGTHLWASRADVERTLQALTELAGS